MSKHHQNIRTPGAVPQRQQEPADVPAVVDDLAEFDESAPLPQVDPVQAQLAEMQAEIARLKRRGQAEPAKKHAQEPEMSEAEAVQWLAEQVASGVRPRAVLTPSGWMTHREMARGPGSLGNAQAAPLGG